MSLIYPHLGILVSYNYHLDPPFSEKAFFKILSLYGQKEGITVTVFSLEGVHWYKDRITGYRYSPQKDHWIKGSYPIPSIIYDRIFYFSKGQLQRFHSYIYRLIKEKNVVFLGRGLPGKWKVYEMCKDNEHLVPFLPETIKLDSTSVWKKKLDAYPSLFFKPVSGTHGKRVFKMTKRKEGIYIEGRSATNQLFSKYFFSLEACEAWLRKITHRHSYIFQPYLLLNTKSHIPFDVRILVQKSDHGQWEETGRVVRMGKKKGLTSNLHGGGTAVEANLFLQQHYSKKQLDELYPQLQTITSHLPTQLEKKHGPLLELGIDVGIDDKGKAWILEANSKPGRRSFRITENKKVMRNSLLAPIRYAKYVVSHYGRSIRA